MTDRPRDIMARLHPYGMASTLIRGGIVIGIYEALEDRVIDKVRWFVDRDYSNDSTAKPSQHYRDTVLALADKGTYVTQGSIRWLQNTNAITEVQAEAFWQFRAIRHQFAHEMLREAIQPTIQVSRADFDGLLEFARAHELFWARLELDLDEEVDSMQISDDDIGLPYYEALSLMRDSIDAAEGLFLHAVHLVESGIWPPTSPENPTSSEC